jgi:hypothetical protein
MIVQATTYLLLGDSKRKYFLCFSCNFGNSCEILRSYRNSYYELELYSCHNGSRNNNGSIKNIIGVEIIHIGDQGKHELKPLLFCYCLVHHHHPLEHFGKDHICFFLRCDCGEDFLILFFLVRLQILLEFLLSPRKFSRSTSQL